MRRLVFLISVLACGCPGARIGDQGVVCASVGSQTVALDEITAGGFTPGDVLDDVVGAHDAVLSWEAGGDTRLTLTATRVGGDILWVDYEPAEDDRLDAMACPDLLEFGVEVAFVTEDGAFDEVWSVTGTSASGERTSFFQKLDLDALNGAYEVTQVDPDDYDSVEARVSGWFEASGATGEISGLAQGEDLGDGLSADAQFTIAAWAPSSEE